MKKLLMFVLTLSVLFGIGQGNSFADQQIDEGQSRGQSGAVSKFFVGRNARQDTTISKDRVVVFDATSNDGVSITTTTTSWDGLVAGVTIDEIVGITSDATAANSSGTSNWGRIRVYGRHADVSWDSGAEVDTAGGVSCVAGSKVATHSTAGTATLFISGISDDVTSATRKWSNVSRDHFGVTLEACADQNKTIDIFVNRG